MNNNASILWYDLETFGLETRYDRIAQFAAIRTNMQIEEIAPPIILYGKISSDYLPDPKAVEVTGITPQEANSKGLCEYDLIKAINTEFSKPHTCVAGFNNLNFDDEMVRNALFRNFFDPYEREYRNNCSRWDIIDLVRAAHDFKHESFNWPEKNPETGNPVFKLTSLTRANGIGHENAHDALADVKATIAVAKLIKTREPKLFNWAYGNRKKGKLNGRIVKTPFGRPVLYTSSRFTSPAGCTALITPITVDRFQNNRFHCFDLSKDPTALISAKNEEELMSAEGVFTLPINKCPLLTPIFPKKNYPAPEIYTRLGIDSANCFSTWRMLQQHPEIILKFRGLEPYESEENDTDFTIYSGGFFSDSDKQKFRLIHQAEPAQKLSLNLQFEDQRVPEMLFRHVARNWPEALTDPEMKRWRSFCANRILNPPGDVMTNWNFYTRKIEERLNSTETPPEHKILLNELKTYGEELYREVFGEKS